MGRWEDTRSVCVPAGPPGLVANAEISPCLLFRFSNQDSLNS